MQPASRKDISLIMKPPVDTIRLGKQSRDHLIKLRRNTGIENWNILCRWAFCASIKEPTIPPVVKMNLEEGVEMTWKVFAGENADLYASLFISRVSQDKPDAGDEELSGILRDHIQRGLSYLASGTKTRSIGALIERWVV